MAAGALSSAQPSGKPRPMAVGTFLCAVALLFSQNRVHAGFARLGHWFDRLMGVVLIALGVRLALGEVA